MPARWTGWAAVALAGLIAGMGLGWTLWHPKAAKPETYAREVRQQDGSLVLERKPQPDAKPVHQIPEGGKVERIVKVVIQPHTTTPTTTPTEDLGTPTYSGPVSLQAAPCPPVHVDLSLVRMQDQSRRVVASSPDGDVVGGVDIPVEPVPQVKQFKWTASVLRSWEPSTGRQSWGGMVQRNLGPVALGVGGFQGTAFASIGIRF